MNEWSAVPTSSWASTVHTPGPTRRRGRRDRGALAGQACELHPSPGQPNVDDIGMRWALVWYHNIRPMTSKLGDGHVAA